MTLRSLALGRPAAFSLSSRRVRIIVFCSWKSRVLTDRAWARRRPPSCGRFSHASVSSISYEHRSVATPQECCLFGETTGRSHDITFFLRTARHFISIAGHSTKHWRLRRAKPAPI